MPNMRAVVVIDGPEGPTLELQHIERPQPGAHELLVRIRAAGLNRTDLRRIQQHHASDGKRHVAGLEMAGEVVAVGSEVHGWAPGDRVMSQGNGCYAEYVAVDHRLALRVPEGLSWEGAAAVPVTFVTAHDALVTAGGMQRGHAVLVQAVTSGVGIAAIQVASVLGSSKVIGTTRALDRAAPLRELGLQLAIDSRSDPAFAQHVLDATAGRGVDVVVDMIGAGVLDQNLRCTALGGRIVSVGRMGGMKDTIDLDLLALRRVSLVGVTFRTRALQDKQRVNERFMADLGAALASGHLRPLVDRSYPLEQALQAQEYMRSNAHLGKIVLLP